MANLPNTPLTQANLPTKNVSVNPDRGLGVDLSDDNEEPRPGPSKKTLIAFGLSLFPIIGYLGGLIAGHGLWLAHRQKQPASGLLYAAVCLQLLYTIVGLTTLAILTNLPQLTQLQATTPDTKQGQEFLSSYQSDSPKSAKYFEPNIFPDAKTALSLYQDFITEKPKLAYSRVVDNAQFIDAKIASVYNGKSASFQIWKVGASQFGQRYILLVMGASDDQIWRIVQISGVELVNDSNARSLGDKLVVDSIKP